MRENITLVRDGRATAVIVAAQGLTEPVCDFVHTVARMSGAAIPVVAESRPGRTEIHVGRTPFVEERRLVPDDLPVNGFRVGTLDGNLVITGTSAIGISHGVYYILTRVLGVMWGMADELFEDIPHKKTVEIAPVDVTKAPPFGFRVFSGADDTWRRRNGVDPASPSLPFYGHGHNLFNILPPSKYSDNPEYYAFYDGKRHVPEKDGHTPIQPCMTNPEVIRIAIDTVREAFDADVERTTYSLCPNDSDKFCMCETCAALDDTMERYRGRRMNSNSYFHFVTQIAEALLESHRDRYVSVYAYWTTELLPQQLERLPSNVVVYLTQDSSQYHDPEYEKRDHEIRDQWAGFADHLAVYDYYGLGWYTPRVYTDVISRTLPSLPEQNVKGFYCEAYPHWAHTAPMLYLATRLLWNLDEDADGLLDEWCSRMFRDAGRPMRAFYRIIEEGWMTRWRKGRWFRGLTNLHIHGLSWTPEFRERAWGNLQTALESTADELTKRRINYVIRGHRPAYLISLSYEIMERITPDYRDLEVQARELLSVLREGIAACTHAYGNDPTYGSAYYHDRGLNMAIERWKGVVAMALKEALANHGDLKSRLADDDALFAELMELSEKPDWIEWIEATRREGEELV